MANQSEENKMQVYVKNLKGTSQAFDISNDETVDSLMKKVEEQLGITKNQQRLIFGGRNLVSGKKLTDYRIKHASTIHLVFRQLGGN
ncbi:polyubiquitin 11 [Anaeramoeba ignava]|uniref:Polyubiquitin 11 n=1 Tax=Anaeramoeba ignava TaxID=1746090 RepID=A0A9Q0RH42_ANAIG|nr:polyubiquitin 11 [Anaeramoeba ignava]